jgi:ribosomal protein L23
MATPSKFRLYLPNLVFKLVYTKNLPPNEVVFQVPQHCNKLDIRQYLHKIYGMEISDVRTMNVTVAPSDNKFKKEIPRFKKAYVTLADGESFTWPPAPSLDELNKIRLQNPREMGQFGKNSMKKIFKKLDG